MPSTAITMSMHSMKATRMALTFPMLRPIPPKTPKSVTKRSRKAPSRRTNAKLPRKKHPNVAAWIGSTTILIDLN